MEPRKPMAAPIQLNGLNADPSMFEKGDFVTQQDMLMSKDPSMMMAVPPQGIDEFPDLHTDPGIPNAERRRNINSAVDNQVMNLSKQQILEENIQKDIDGARKKFDGLPSDPKSVLKHLISKGEYQETFELFEHKWTLRALDQNDLLLALDEVKDSLETQSGRVTAVMFAQVVYALEAIDNVPIYKWFPDISLDDYHGNKMEYILAVKRAARSYMGALAPTVIDNLYIKYLEVEEKRNQALVELKNS